MWTSVSSPEDIPRGRQAGLGVAGEQRGAAGSTMEHGPWIPGVSPPPPDSTLRIIQKQVCPSCRREYWGSGSELSKIPPHQVEGEARTWELVSRWVLIQSSNSFLKKYFNFFWLHWSSLLCVGYSLAVIFGLPVAGASRCRAQARGCMGLSSWGTGMWDLCSPGIEPVSTALAGRFFFFVKENLFLIGELLYNIVLISAIHQHESATSTHTHVPSRLPPHPTLLGCHRAPVWVP